MGVCRPVKQSWVMWTASIGHHLFQKFGIGIERFGNAQALRSSVVDGELVGGTTAFQSIDFDP